MMIYDEKIIIESPSLLLMAYYLNYDKPGSAINYGIWTPLFFLMFYKNLSNSPKSLIKNLIEFAKKLGKFTHLLFSRHINNGQSQSF